MKTGNNAWKTPLRMFTIFLVFIFVLFLQYLYLAISPNVYGINLQEFASKRNTYSGILYSKRGTIYDKDGNTLAMDITSYTVIAYLDESRTGSSTTLYHVVDKEGTAKALAPLINMSANDILDLLNADAYQVELGPGGRGITELTKRKIEELNLPGIDFMESYKRYYPNGDFASYIIGYTKKKNIEVDINGTKTIESSLVGELGIEVKYDELLRGYNGYTKYQQDRYGVKIPDTKEEKQDPVNGANIYLTIDSNIQRILENAMNDAKKYNPEWVTISIMDAKNGDILGSASTPSYDPNILNIVNYENPLTTYEFEPGSIMKIFTYMCAIEKGTYDGDDKYPSGSIDFDGTTIYDWKHKGWGDISFDRGFELSSNVGVSYIMERFLTRDDLKACFAKYGFGTETGVELPREQTGNVSFKITESGKVRDYYPIEVASASFGQGIWTTPIQHLQALSMIANDGYMVKPHIVDKIVSDSGIVYESSTSKEQVISSETASKLKELMYNVVHVNDATGIDYNVEGLNVIGKTGTAEIYENGSYLKEYIYSFSGIFPADDPQIIVVVSMKRPSTDAAIRRVTRSVIEAIGNYKGLLNSSTIDDNPSKYIVSSYINKDVTEVSNMLKEDHINVKVIGNGNRVIKQYPLADSVALDNEEIVLITNSVTTMPSLIGYSRIKAMAILNMLNISFEMDGYGFVNKQSISPGSPINDNVILTLEERYSIN